MQARLVRRICEWTCIQFYLWREPSRKHMDYQLLNPRSLCFWERNKKDFDEIDGISKRKKKKTFIFPQFLSPRPCEALSLETLYSSGRTVKSWRAERLLQRSNKAARHYQIIQDPPTYPLVLIVEGFPLCKWSLDGRFLPRPPAVTVVGVQGRTWTRADQWNLFFSPQAVALGGLWNSLGWTCWEVATFPFSSFISVSYSLWQIWCLFFLY